MSKIFSVAKIFQKFQKFFYRVSYFVNSNQWSRVQWSYGVMAITLDFESNNPSSNLGRTSLFTNSRDFEFLLGGAFQNNFIKS